MSDPMEINYSPELVYAYIISCVIDDNGVPRFMEKVPFHPEEKNTVTIACRDYDDNDLLVSIKVKGVPDELYNLIKQKGPHRPAEWKKVLAALLHPETVLSITLPKVSSGDKQAMKFISERMKIDKVDHKTAMKILENIRGSKTFYDII